MRIRAGGVLGATRKMDQSIVTHADMAANEVIVCALSELTPAIPIVSEEGTHDHQESDIFWLVDPLDATAVFARGGNEFTVNIGLIHTGAPVLGVVTAPAFGDLAYIGGKNLPPQKRNRTGEWAPISVSGADAGKVTIAIPHQGNNRIIRDWIDVNYPDAEKVWVGSSLKLCMIAEGRVHLYPRPAGTSEWDTAAAHAILNAAGGRISFFEDQDREMDYGKPSYKNPSFLASFKGSPTFR